MKNKWISETMCVGLELEYEGTSNVTVEDRYSTAFKKRLLSFCADGSLRPRRANTEIKFAGPLSGALIDEALGQIQELLSWHIHKISWRCGMHVHIDCNGTEFLQAYRTAVLCALIEPLLYGWDNAGRQENKFCQSIVDSVYSYIGSQKPALTKYALVNLQSLFRIQTLEFRFASSTKNIPRMRDFINLSMGLRNSCEGFKSSEALVRSILDAKSVAAWLEEHTHPLMHEQLIPVSKAIGFTEPTTSALNAALCLVEYEPKIKPVIIGGY